MALGSNAGNACRMENAHYKEKEVFLCSACGGTASLSGGIAPTLKEMLHEKHGIDFDDDD